MKITFHGAAKTVTGSKHLLTLSNGTTLLLDCGLFQGLGKETTELNNDFGFDPESIDLLLLSHAHIDHSGLIPKLVKDGFKGKIYCTLPTKELTEILLHDSAEIQMYESTYANKHSSTDVHSAPLYTNEDVINSMKLFSTVEYDTWLTIGNGIQVLFSHTGHLVGSSAISIKISDDFSSTTLLYTGDIGRYQSVLMQKPTDCIQADYIITESTYGDKRHNVRSNSIESLYKWIEKVCSKRKGKLIIPAFSVGRTQEILYALNQLSLEKRLPEIPVFVDSPLSQQATQTIKKYTNEFNERLQKVLTMDEDPFDFPGLKYIETVEDSKKLVALNEPCIIISASGTADAGRVKHHIASAVSDNKNAILFAGYCGERSLGGQLLSGKKEVEINGDLYKVHAQIGKIDGMSAHGDCDDICKFLHCQNPEQVQKIFLVHGEVRTQSNFMSKLELKGFKNIEIPSMHESFEIGIKKEKAKAA
jgi:metallo-beta-lactamase family protein